MEDPVKEILSLAQRLTSSPYPKALRDDIETYFLPNAGLRHPLCYIQRAPGSRDNIFAVYSNYRMLSPHTTSGSRVLVYDREKNMLILEVIQSYHIFFSPFRPAPARLIVQLTLDKDEQTGMHRIAYQEDFYHPDHLMNMILPPLAPFVRLLLKSAVFFSNVLAPVEDILGLFSNSNDEECSRILALIRPLRILGRELRAMDQYVRAHGVKWSVEDVVPTIPGEMDMLPQPSRRSEL